MFTIEKTVLSERLIKRYPSLEKLGTIEQILPAAKSDFKNFSRLTSIKLLGTNGQQEFLRAEDFRLTLDPTGRKIKSTAFKIQDLGDKWAFTNGRGWGHGVGLCQYGTQEMARKGFSAEQILTHYYPDSKITLAY